MLEKKGLVKLSEEIGELGQELCAVLLLKQLSRLEQVAAKKMTCMESDEHWDGAGSLKERLENEIGDVMAAAEQVIKNFGLDRNRIIDRSNTKFKLFETWMSEES